MRRSFFGQNIPSSEQKSIPSRWRSIFSFVCKVGLGAGVGSSIHSVGAAILSGRYAGYSIAEAASIGAAGYGIMTLLVLSSKYFMDSSPLSECTYREIFIIGLLGTSAATLIGWGILDVANIGSMTPQQAIASNYIGGVTAIGGTSVPMLCFLAYSIMKPRRNIEEAVEVKTAELGIESDAEYTLQN